MIRSWLLLLRRYGSTASRAGEPALARHPPTLLPRSSAGSVVGMPCSTNDCHCCTVHCSCPLLPAAATHRYDAARELLTQAGAQAAALLEARDALGRSALAVACRAGHGRLIKLLLRKGTCMDAQDADGLTALHHAVLGGHRAVAQHLLRAGADPTLRNNAGVDGAQLIAGWAAQQQGQQDVLQEEQRLPQDGPPE